MRQSKYAVSLTEAERAQLRTLVGSGVAPARMLARARVLLKAPAIVILDEATAHLDSETEVLVQQALAEALAGRTSVVIAHRLSTIRAADEILVIDGGRIVERGPHEQLLAAGGLYAELYETQYGGSRAGVGESDTYRASSR